MTDPLILCLLCGKSGYAVPPNVHRCVDPRTAAVLDRRSSGAAGTHGDRRTKRQRTRSSQKRRAVEEF